jgi:hypothetical protein
VRELASGEKSERFELLHQALTEPVRQILVPLIEAAHREARNCELDANFAFFAALGAMAISLATRKHIARFAPAAENDDQMRPLLAVAMRAILCP